MLLWTNFLFYIVLINSALASIKFTNIKCTALNETYAIKQCELKLIKRGVVGINIHIKIPPVQFNDLKIHLSFYRKANGFRPFLFNRTTDFCKFLRNPKKIPFMQIMFENILPYSNINHSCPYDHDVIIRNLSLDESSYSFVPLPNGEYMYKIMVGTTNGWMFAVQAYVTINLQSGI